MNTWRYLKKNEVIREGDEFLSPSEKKWRPVKHVVGEHCGNTRRFRRAVRKRRAS